MSVKDFDKLGVDNFVVFRAKVPSNWKVESNGATYVAGHTYYIVTRVVQYGNAKKCYLIDSTGVCDQFSSVNSYNFRWWQTKFSNGCQIVYQGKDFADAWNFVQSRSDAEKFV